jgi:hypothetical protein
MQKEAEMNSTKILEAMQTLSQDKNKKNRSAIARLRSNFAAIELALSNGVKRKAIWEEFKKEGYEIPLKTFESAIYRIRKDGNKHKNESVVAIHEKPNESPSGKTGFHQVVEQIASKNSSEDPRRD